MKVIINISVILFCNFLFAQTLPVLSTTSLSNPDQQFTHYKNGNYAVDTNNQRSQYVGLWEYNQNGIIFQLKIEKQDKALDKREYNGVISKYNYVDQVILRYKLIKNGVVLFDDLNVEDINYGSSYDPIISYGIKGHSIYMNGRLLDHSQNVVGSYTIQKLPSITPKIKFDLGLGNYSLLNDPASYQNGQPLFSIPTGGIEMVKVN